MSQIEIARAIAHIAHIGQTDKAGNPYIEHPARVAQRLSAEGNSENVVAAGWLHDVLEDSPATRDDLHAAGVDWLVINMVELVTRTPDVTPEDYYAAIGRHGGATSIKLADIADNTDPSRLALLDDATIARLTRKYAKARRLIEAA
ncbi:HD domain-containing protein [Curtobacterium sp. UCD-KPL2560]|uniref:HD domain-containing protein n=1 Tax=Curtobacterium sp. UCD-KPL2560 TaxID=1885315 RepID=UPI0008252D8F|nr:HD domain-containing protein [Curtobacterium sp. UCD-KPL2560]